MHKIEEKIKLKTFVKKSDASFANNEIKNTINHEFYCVECGKQHHLKIALYEPGNACSVDELYSKAHWLAKSELLLKNEENKIYYWSKTKGNLFISCLSASYVGINCEACKEKYICFFSFGEKQPGLDLFTIAGIWSYEIDNTQTIASRLKKFLYKVFKS